MLHETRHATPSCVYLSNCINISRYLPPVVHWSVISRTRLNLRTHFGERKRTAEGDRGFWRRCLSKSESQQAAHDLSWASSRLEGNTYTYLDTQTLIEYGQRNEDKPLEEAAMIL